MEAKAPTRFAELGARIRRARKRKGLSQERLAPLAGTTRRHLIRLENGENQASPQLAARLAEVLDEDGSQFRNGGDEDDEESRMVRILMSAVRQAVHAEMSRVAV